MDLPAASRSALERARLARQSRAASPLAALVAKDTGLVGRLAGAGEGDAPGGDPPEGDGNSAPVAQPDAATTSEDTPATIDVLSNDSDPDGDYFFVIDVSQPANGTDSFSYTLADGHGGVQTATVTVTMVEVTDWTLQRETLDGTWVSVPDDEVCWSHDNLRWTAEFGPKNPPDVLGIDWLAKPWDQRDDPGASWDEFAFSEADAPGLGSPGTGDWAITPEVMLSAPNQTEFAVQMAQPKRKIVAKIEEIEWATHGNAGRPGIRRLLGCICNGRIRRTRLFPTSVSPTR